MFRKNQFDEFLAYVYQSLIGSLQWAVSLGRLDITTTVMTMSGFRANPREGHLVRARRIVGFLVKFKHASLRYRTGCPGCDVQRQSDCLPKFFLGIFRWTQILLTCGPKSFCS